MTQRTNGNRKTRQERPIKDTKQQKIETILIFDVVGTGRAKKRERRKNRVARKAVVHQMEDRGKVLVFVCFGSFHCEGGSEIWEDHVFQRGNCHGVDVHSVSNSVIEATMGVLFSETFYVFIAFSRSVTSLIE